MAEKIPCRCEQCHRISWETQEPTNPDWWFCDECRGEPAAVTVIGRAMDEEW